MADVSFGQYYPANSFLHKCNPCVKILFLIVYIVAIFLGGNFYTLAACGIAFLLMVSFSGIPFKTLLRSVKGVIFVLLFMVVLNLFFGNGETVLLQWGVLTITKEAVYWTIFLTVRWFLLILCSALLTLTTTPVALADGLEVLLTPLKWVKFPVRALSLIMSIALRMIPILTEETGRIMNAQKARGADLESGGLIKRVQAIVPTLIPLLVGAFRRALELADAMEARCYSGNVERTKYKKMSFAWRDWLALTVGAVLLTGVIVLKIHTGSIV